MLCYVTFLRFLAGFFAALASLFSFFSSARALQDMDTHLPSKG